MLGSQSHNGCYWSSHLNGGQQRAMKSDISRKADIDELLKEISGKVSPSRKQYLERVLDRVLNESKETRQLRDKLVMAVKANDKNSKNYLTDQLLRMRREQIGYQQDYLDIRV